MKARYHFLFFILLLIATTLLLLSGTLLLPEELKRLLLRSPQLDTIGHFIGFFMLAWLMHSLLKTKLLPTLLTLAFYGALSELGQYYLGFRNGELSDFFADLAGISGFIMLKKLYLFYKKMMAKRADKQLCKTTCCAKGDS